MYSVPIKDGRNFDTPVLDYLLPTYIDRPTIVVAPDYHSYFSRQTIGFFYCVLRTGN